MSGSTSRRGMGAAAIGVALLAIVLYLPSLSLPVIYDDLLHIRIAEDLNPVTVWLPTEHFGFYRPLTFLPLLIIDWLFGYYPDWLFHGLNVFQHGLNAILLITLTWRVYRKQSTALVAGALFVSFPFSYQAIVVYGHNVHPTSAGLILLGLHTYLTARRTGSDQHPSDEKREKRGQRRFWWGLTGLLFLLSLLTHESAVLFGGLAALVDWAAHNRLPQLRSSIPKLSLRHWPPWLIFLILGIFYAIVYQFLPVARSLSASGGGEESLWLRVQYVLQAAAYPFTWFAHRLPDIDASSFILGSVALTALLAVWTALRSENRLLHLLGWGWWALAALVVAVPLSTGYVFHGPRLLYLGSIGLSWAWAAILTDQKPGLFRYVWLFGGATFILAVGWQFVRGRLADYTRLTEPVEVIQQVMGQFNLEQSPDQGIVVVNLPQWISPARNTFAVGAELAAMLGEHLFADEIVAANPKGNNAVYSVVLPDLLQPTDYNYGLHDETKFRGDAAATLPIDSDWASMGSQVFIVKYERTGPSTTHVGGFQPSPGTATFLARLGSYDLAEASGTLCNQVVYVNLVWELAGSDKIPATQSIAVQLLSDDGQVIAQADGPPLSLRPDLVHLLPGWQIRDQRTVGFLGEVRPSRLLISAYDFVSGERFSAFDDEHNPFPDNAFPIELLPCR